MDPFASRRDAVFSAISPGVAVFFATPVALRNNDVEHEYRQDSDVHYLTGFDEQESVLVLSTDGRTRKVVLFVRPKDRERETWDGLRAGVEGAKQRYGADEAYPIGDLETKLAELFRNRKRLYYRLGRDRAADDIVLAALDGARARGKIGLTWPTEIVEPGTIVHEMRRKKSAEEIALLRRAAEITAEAHIRAMGMARPGRFEYEVEAVLRETFRRHGAERCAYQPIVGSGPNATILHYRANSEKLVDGALLLIDAGCEYEYYASDVTRTFPVRGRFTEPQREIYEIVLEAQLASIEKTVVGATVEDVHKSSVEVLVDGLLRLGILHGSRAEAIEQGSYRPYYMHRTSHYLGMDVHDVGLYFADGEPRKLEPGVCITVEPGLYFRDNDESVAPRYRGIGVRIEDDVIVTEGAPDVLTSGIPKTVHDVEHACLG